MSNLFCKQFPGAFTPTCSLSHLPGYIQNLPQLKAKGVDIVAVLAFNDAWVMSAWGKANKVTDKDFVCFVFANRHCTVLIVRSSFCPTLMQNSPRASAGPILSLVALVVMPWSLTTVRSHMLVSRPNVALSRCLFHALMSLLLLIRFTQASGADTVLASL